ncbi:autotransporter domain-containing protein [Stutzerimonas stutzeri]|uniref:Outer membrane lipase/esterase n=1 Tax=Stutzerimonas stutzeri TaxID=316 RepID=A0A5S5B4Z3_STUST|nr:autotransporter domain-containing SGNH/GDSL hydrolase family protein [Stutzerimonas stutzeri]TYP62121.1 outer membrane lipase/esterase [Stutzerimonas stutzeri]
MQSALKPLALAILLAGVSVAAHAETSPYSQFVNFGDSLSDAGNFPDVGSPLLGGNPTGGLRFTNRTGPTYAANNTEYAGQVVTQVLANRLGLQSLPSTPILPRLLTGNPDGTNYAVGGYRTDQILDSLIGTSTVDAGGGLTRSRPGYLVQNPQVDPNGLYYLNGGANDIFQLQARPTTMALAAANMVQAVGALQNAGARYIIISDLPDVGNTPLGTQLGTSAFLNSLSDSFNAELAAGLQAQGGNYVLLNNRLLLSEVRADLARYGFDPTINQTAVCFDGGNCPLDPTYGLGTANADPSRLLFNDAVHPTTAVHQISADYIYSILSAPAEVSLLPEMGRSALRNHLRLLDSELAAQRGNWQSVGGWRTFVHGGYNRPEYDGFGGGDGDSPTLAIGLSNRVSEHWLAGLSLGLAQNSLSLGAGDSDYDMRSYLASAFASYQQDRFFADLNASAGYLDYDSLDRTFSLGVAERSEKGSTEGMAWGVSAKTGFNLMQMGDPLEFGPFIGASYQKIDVDGYREQGASSTALSYEDQELESLRLSVGLFGTYAVSERTRLFGEVAREVEREDEQRDDLRMSLNSVPTNSFELPGATPTGDQTRFSVGIAHQLTTGLSVRANYNYQGNDNRNQGVGLSLALDL